jgi:septin 7
MHFDIGLHAKGRTRSVQLERGLNLVAHCPPKAESMKDAMGTPPVPSARSSSLPTGKENSGSIRHYRSMLDVEDPPKLGPVMTFTYDELYVGSAKLQNSQASHPLHPSGGILHNHPGV